MSYYNTIKRKGGRTTENVNPNPDILKKRGKVQWESNHLFENTILSRGIVLYRYQLNKEVGPMDVMSYKSTVRIVNWYSGFFMPISILSSVTAPPEAR